MIPGVYYDRLSIINNIALHSVYYLDIIDLLIPDMMEGFRKRLHDAVIGNRDRIVPP